MKEDSRPPLKHEFEHAAPTVVHDPDEDMTLLARWLRRGVDQGPKFWWLAGGVLAVALVAMTLAGGLSRGKTSVGKAWSDLLASRTAGQKVEIADAFPDSDVAHLARLQAAAEYFGQATFELPSQKDSALAQLKKALDLFEQVARDAPKGSSEALTASFGVARTLEARNELPEAIERYQAVVAGWPDSAEAKRAGALIARLKEPEVVDFYKQLYAYKPPTVSTPPGLPGFGPPSAFPSTLGGPLPSVPVAPGETIKLPSFMTPGSGPLDIPAPPEVKAPSPAVPPPSTVDPKLAPVVPKPEPKAAELPTDPFTKTAPKL